MRECDPVMRGLLARLDVGSIFYVLNPSGFCALAESIASQFLSYHAAEVIWTRVQALTGGTPEGFIGTSDESLRVAGLSYSKISALKNLATKAMSGEVNFEKLREMPDSAAIDELVKLKGVGPWMAEMFLIFSFGCPDVFPWRDVGLMRAIEYFYKLPGRPDAKEMEEISSPWRPHRSTAAIILWEAIHQKMVK